MSIPHFGKGHGEEYNIDYRASGEIGCHILETLSISNKLCAITLAIAAYQPLLLLPNEFHIPSCVFRA